MDPNATLDKIRECTRKLEQDRLVPFLRDLAVNDLVEAVSDLDEWVSRGGFLPSDWAALQRRS